jgi:hypothetical protein
MNCQDARLDLLLDLEARHEKLIAQLDELNIRVERALAEWQPRGPAPSSADLE